MPDIDFPSALVDLQLRSHTAWGEVEAHRKAVDAARRDAPRIETTLGPALREWTEKENAEHERLMAAAKEAAVELRAAVQKFMAESPEHSHYEATQQLHKAARE
jgi:hypothetical protein